MFDLGRARLDYQLAELRSCRPLSPEGTFGRRSVCFD